MDEMEDLYEDMADLNAAWKSLTSKPDQEWAQNLFKTEELLLCEAS